MIKTSRLSLHDLLALLVLLLAATLAWSKRIGGGDTFVSLAAGRDALAGKIGLPDEWSFTTEGRVWLNQNWGSHTTYYVAYRLFGDAGPVAVKWLVIFGTMLLMVRAATERGANRCFAATVVAVTILAARSYLDVRPHIFTLLCEAGLIVILFQWYKGSRVWAFVAAALIGFWANMHGGFIFGIGVMGLWLGVQVFMKLVWSRSRPWEWSHLLALAGGLGVAILMATLINPFGPVNLTHPLVVEKSDVWMSVQEWHPILDMQALARYGQLKQAVGFGSVTEFLILLGVFAATILAWAMSLLALRRARQETAAVSRSDNRPERRGHRRRDKRHRDETTDDAVDPSEVSWVGRWGLFDLALTWVVLAMAFRARRFIPLATVAIVPILIPMMEDTVRRIKLLVQGEAVAAWTPSWLWGLSGADVALLLVGCILAYFHVYLPYHDPNPVYPKQTVLMRMVGSQTFPEQAMDFLEAQKDLPPETFVDWRWEGFTRWRTDKLKTFCGGRAQQVHSEPVARWQISTPGRGARPIRFARITDGILLNNGQLATLVGLSGPEFMEIGIERIPTARIGTVLTIEKDGETAEYRADKTVSYQFGEVAEYWADADVVVERTAEPKFRAEYVVSIVGDPPLMGPLDPRIIGGKARRCGFCDVRLKRLTNTGASAYKIVNHNLSMRSVLNAKEPIKLLGQKDILFYQVYGEKGLRFGMAASRDEARMWPRVQGAGTQAIVGATLGVQKNLGPNEAFAPEGAEIVVFADEVPPNCPAYVTRRTLLFLESQSCRDLVNEADERGINIFILPKQSSGLAMLLLGSKKWACVFDDGTAYVLLRRADPRNQRLIKEILAGKAPYPDEFLKALGMALTRHSVAPTYADTHQFRDELRSVLKLEPDYAVYWWLRQVMIQCPQSNKPEDVKQDLDFWLDQWRLLSKGPPTRQQAVWTYYAQQIVAEVLRNTYAKLRDGNEAQRWNDKLNEISNLLGELKDIYT